MDYTEDELRAKLKEIEKRCAYWLPCNDGSYELALDDAGWNFYYDKLKRITNGKNDVTSNRD